VAGLVSRVLINFSSPIHFVGSIGELETTQKLKKFSGFELLSTGFFFSAGISEIPPETVNSATPVNYS
jgi:hypothetical protein